MTALLGHPWLQLQAAALAGGFGLLTVAALLAALALRHPASAPGWPPRILRWTRPGFLLLSLALAAGVQAAWESSGEVWSRSPRELWGLFAWLVCFAVLHVHRVKAFQGRPAILAGLAGWGLTLAAWLVM
jgi:cytochrome c biogenesis factor